MRLTSVTRWLASLTVLVLPSFSLVLRPRQLQLKTQFRAPHRKMVLGVGAAPAEALVILRGGGAFATKVAPVLGATIANAMVCVCG